ncbi:MAG: phage tail assembly chaperone [Sphingomonadaceae bacterium]|nr:phage tail assembly chaperone [Sphingomonadaceae bacterium]
MAADGAFGPRALLLAGLAARVLGWRPAEFWAATPAELAAALGLPAAHGPALDTQGLRQLMERFPDGR